jgi:hypothetical protein
MKKTKDHNNFLEKIIDKEILITNTKNETGLAYYLAHVIRNYAKRVYCLDNNYKMSFDFEGYRIIEDGKVVLIKGNLNDEKTDLIIKKLNGKIDFYIEIYNDKR